MKKYILTIVAVFFAVSSFALTFDDGMNAYNQQNYKKAAEIWTTLANAGNVDAMYNLGVLYIKGQGVTASDFTGAKWAGQAADRGHTRAKYTMGLLYKSGSGVSQDRGEAYRNFYFAAKAGIAEAQYELADMYEEIPHFYRVDEALGLYKKAAEQGVAQAQYVLGVRYCYGLAVKEDRKEGTFWAKQAIQSGFFGEKALKDIKDACGL
ncbi:MAG: tetratricopeptide repeat protein [Deferribacterales bacterium]